MQFTSLILVLIAIFQAPATTQDVTAPACILLKHDGTLARTDGAPTSRERDLDTISTAPSGNAIVATRGNVILLIPLDGAAPTVLLKHPTPVRFATIAPNGQFLAFSAGAPEDGQKWNVWLAHRDADGAFIEAKAIDPGYGYDPSFSRDSRFIYFETSGQLGQQLACFDRKAGVMVPDSSRTFAGGYTVRCSPDGKWIAFSRERAICLYNTSDKSVRRLSDGVDYDRFASFVGEDVLFFRETRTGRHQVVAIRVDGSKQRVLYEGSVRLLCGLPHTR